MKTKQERALNYAIEKIGHWAHKKNINKIYLYGSVARGDFSENSDVDLYIELNGPIPNKELRKFRAEIVPVDNDCSEIDLHYGFKPLHEYTGLYYDNIRKDGKILWEKK